MINIVRNLKNQPGKEYFKKSYKNLLIWILLFLISVIGISYALWQKNYKQSNLNTISTNCFKVKLLNETESIKMDNVLPTSDEEAMTYEGYTFTIKNVCEKPAYYQVNLEELIEEAKLPNKYIRVSLNDSKGKNLDTFKEVPPTIENTDISHKLTSGALRENEEVTYNLKMWMAEDTPPIKEVMNKTFSSKVTITATYKEEVELENEIKITVESKNKEISNQKEELSLLIESINYDIVEYSFDEQNFYQIENPGKNITLDVTFLEEGKHLVYIKDEVGNSKEIEIDTTKLDQTAPSISVEENDKQETIELSISFEDEKSGLFGYKITESNEIPTSWDSFNKLTRTNNDTKTVTFIISKNATYYIWVIDKAGNVNYQAYSASTIDTKAPTLEIRNTLTSYDLRDSIIIRATDDIIGLSGLSITKTENEYHWEVIEKSPLEYSKTVEIEENGTYYISVKDAYEHITTKKILIDKIDKQAPVVESVTGNQSSWTNQNVTLTVNASDSKSGLHQTAYSFDNGTTWQEENTKTYTDNTNNIIIKVRDALGNIYTNEAINITKIDKTAPTITSVSGNPSSWTNQNVTLTVNGASDSKSGLHQTAYSFDNGTTWQAGNTKTYTDNTNNIIIKVRDALGNIYTNEAINITKIDKTAPTITSVTGNPSSWTNQNVTLTVNGASDSKSGLHQTAYSFDNGTTWQAGNTKTYTANTSNIIIKVRDTLGNIYTNGAINITKIDKTPPAKPTLVNSSNGQWTNGNVVVDVSSSDIGSQGIKFYYSYDKTTWLNDWDSTSSTTAKGTWRAERNNTTYFKAVDSVGNTSEYAETTIKIDKTAQSSTFSVASSTAGSNSWYKALSIKVSLSTGASGVSSAKYCVTTSSTCTPGTNATISSNSYTVTLGTASSAQKVCATVTDNAKNTSSVQCSSAYSVDTANPTAKISASSSGDTITISANGSSDSGSGISTYYYSKDNSNWSSSTSNIYNFTGYSDGTHTVYVKVTDKSGRTSSTVSTSVVVAYQNVYVSSSGNDSTGNGSSSKPYATLAKAYSRVGSGKNIILLSNITATQTANFNTANKSVILKSNGSSIYTITKSSDLKTAIISVSNSNRLDTSSIVFNGNNVSSTQAVINISGSSTLNLNSGTTVKGGNNTNTYQGGGINSSSSTININGATITDNKSNNQGAGVYINGGTVNLNSGTISSNTFSSTFGQGGGLFIWQGTGNIKGGTISNNNARDGVGGGVWVGGRTTKATLTMTAGTITKNNAAGGGGLSINSDDISVKSTATISGGTISSNTANYGAGIDISKAILYYNGGTTTGNVANEGGGALNCNNSSTCNLAGGSFTSNSASKGGAVHISNSGVVSASGTTVSNNKATNGDGGGFVSYQCTLNISGGKITGNTATVLGGGVKIDGGTGSISVNAEVSGNTAQYGGGVAVAAGGTFTATGGSIHENTATENGGGVDVNAATFILQGGSVVRNKCNKSDQVGGVAVCCNGKFQNDWGTVSANTPRNTW